MIQIIEKKFRLFYIYSRKCSLCSMWCVVTLFVLIALLQNTDLSKIISEQGCLEAIEEWTEQNMISLASCTFVILLFQVSCFLSSLSVARIFLPTYSDLFFLYVDNWIVSSLVLKIELLVKILILQEKEKKLFICIISNTRPFHGKTWFLQLKMQLSSFHFHAIFLVY